MRTRVLVVLAAAGTLALAACDGPVAPQKPPAAAVAAPVEPPPPAEATADDGAADGLQPQQPTRRRHPTHLRVRRRQVLPR